MTREMWIMGVFIIILSVGAVMEIISPSSQYDRYHNIVMK